MKPYYSHNGIILYHADCRDIVNTLGRFDLLLTDPPYGIGDRMQGGTWGAKAKYADFRSWDVAPEVDFLSLVISMAAKSIIWGGNYFALEPSRCWLVWDKKNAVPTMADCEFAWTNLDRPAKRLSLPVGVHRYGHPTEKPMALFYWCIEQAGDVQTIFDPYAGSGTTLEAAKKCGLNATGIEANEKYCEITARRLQQEMLPFGPNPSLVPTPKAGLHS